MSKIFTELFSSLIILVYLKVSTSFANPQSQVKLYLKAMEKHQLQPAHDYKVSSIPVQTWSIQRGPLKKADSLAQWSSNILQDQNVNKLTIVEPGFDLTDEEIEKFKIWPQGIIPYFIDDFSYDKVLRDRIRSFLDVISGVTGLNFIELPKPPEDADERWVFFVNRRGQLECDDHTPNSFTNRGVQKVVLGYDCMSTSGELAVAVLALVGIPPQHNSPDRDKFIKVTEDNILPDKAHLFEKIKNTEWLFHDISSYDWHSAGHYHWHKYTKNGKATIMPLISVEYPVGEANGFSYTDIWKIRMLYNFISKKKNMKAPTCNKIFVPGKNFSSYKADSEDEIEPRKKPNKYLGLPDDQPSEPKKYNNTQSDSHNNETQLDQNSDNENHNNETQNINSDIDLTNDHLKTLPDDEIGKKGANQSVNRDIDKSQNENSGSSELNRDVNQNQNSRLESDDDRN